MPTLRSYPPLEGEGRASPQRGGERGAVTVAKRNSVDNFRKRAAHRMRMTATAAEARLWQHLRRHPMAGSHFRRQVVIGPYIADFACMAAKLIVEVDGSQHGEEAGKARDIARTKWFEAEGYRVLRYWNNDVSSNIDEVLTDIHAVLCHRADDLASMKHERRRKPLHPTPAGGACHRAALRADPLARRPSPSRGG